MSSTYINFVLGKNRAILRIASDGSAFLDRTRPTLEAPRYGAWRGYWPVSSALRDRLLALPAVKAAMRAEAAHRIWEEAVAVHGIGPMAAQLFRAAC